MQAKGKMFWDDGEKLDSFETGFYQISNFDFSGVILAFSFNIFVALLIKLDFLDETQ